MRLVARPAATAITFESDVGEVDAGAIGWPRRAPGPGVLMLDGVLAVNVRVGDRIAAELLGPGDLLESVRAGRRGAAGLRGRAGGRWCRCASRCSTRRSPSGCGRGRRSCRRCCAGPSGAPATSTCSARSPRSRGSRSGWRCCCGTWRRAGAGSSPAGSGCRCRSPTSCWAGSSAPSGRRCRTRWRGCRASGLVTGHGDEWHLHGSIEDQLGTMIEPAGGPRRAAARRRRRVARSRADARRRVRPGLRARRAPARPRRVADLGPRLRRRVGGDDQRHQPEPRGSAARRAARDAAAGHLQPAAGLRDRRGVHARVLRAPPPGTLDPFVLVLEGSVPNEQISGEGHWAALGVDPATGRADPHLHLDRSAGAAGGRGAGARNLRRLRRDPGDARQPDRRDGAARLPGCRAGSRAAACRSSTSPAARSSPTTSPRRCFTWRCTWSGVEPMIELDEQGRPRVAVRRGPCSRAAAAPASPSRASSRARRPTAAAAWSSSAARARWSSATSRSGAGPAGVGGCPNVGGICIGCTMPGFPDRFMPFMEPSPLGVAAARVRQFTYGPVLGGCAGGRCAATRRRAGVAAQRELSGWRLRATQIRDGEAADADPGDLPLRLLRRAARTR